jgi:hypothetical protein
MKVSAILLSLILIAQGVSAPSMQKSAKTGKQVGVLLGVAVLHVNAKTPIDWAGTSVTRWHDAFSLLHVPSSLKPRSPLPQ